MDRNKLIYWISTGLLSAMMLMSAGMYFFNTEMVATTFTALGFPTYLIYPMGIAKFLGIVAILSNKSKCLKKLAYAGFFFNFILALIAHIGVRDGEYAPAIVALILLSTSAYMDCKRSGTSCC